MEDRNVDYLGLILGLIAVVTGITGLITFVADFHQTRTKLIRLVRPVPAAPSPRLDGESDLDFATSTLRDRVKADWQKEATRRGLLDGSMPITWTVDESRIPHQFGSDAAMMRVIKQWDDPARATVDRLAEFYQAVRPKALVILGDVASGKSGASVLLTVGLLEQPGSDEPVPVQFSLARWDREIDFMAWLRLELLENYTWLRADEHYGHDAATQLLEKGRVLPVMDGIDEIREEDRPSIVVALRGHLPLLPGLILTCRPAEYGEIEDSGLPGAVIVVELAGVQPRQAIEYLKGAVPKTHGNDERWEPIYHELGKKRAGPLAQALKSPLMLYLLPKVYFGRPGRPADLLSRSQEEIEAHLLANFVGSVFTNDTSGRPGAHWKADDADRWLGTLARMMGTKRELAWWEISRHGRPATAVMAGFVAAIISGIAVGLSVTVLFNAVAGLAFGGLTAVGLGVLSAVSDPPPPKDIEVRMTGRITAMVLSGLSIGGIVIVVGSLARDVAFGVVAGIAFGLLIALLYGSTGIDPTARPSEPALLLRRERMVGLTYGLAYGVFAGAVGWLFSADVLFSVVLGIFCALAGAVLQGPVWVISGRGSMGVVAFGHLFLAIAWFGGKRQLPVRLMRFLDDAHREGVLRLAAGKYQFRHENLRLMLAAGSGRGATEEPQIPSTIAVPVEP